MQRITLDIIPNGEKPIVYSSQFDDGRIFGIDLTEKGDPFTYSGTETFEVVIRKPDNNLVTLEATKKSEIVDDQTIYYIEVELSEQANACFGDSICELKITEDETLIGTLNFVLKVERSPEQGGVDSQTAINNLTTEITTILDNELGDILPDIVTPLVDSIISEDVYTKSQTYNKEEVNALIPTKTSELTNDSGFITSSDIPDIPSDLEDLSNVDIVNPTDGQILGYDSNTSKWKNINNSGGGGVLPTLINLTTNQNITIKYAYYFEIGEIVYVCFAFTTGSEQISIHSTVFNNLPLPQSNVVLRFPCCIRQTSSTAHIFAELNNSNGYLAFETTINAGYSVSGSFFYKKAATT